MVLQGSKTHILHYVIAEEALVVTKSNRATTSKYNKGSYSGGRLGDNITSPQLNLLLLN